MRNAREITFSAYFLHDGPVERALEAAARRKAHVVVRVDGCLWGAPALMRRENADAVRALREAGADARLVHLSDSDGPGLHLKAAVCDGAAFLDGCNWNWGDTVLRDNAGSHVRAVRRAVTRQSGESAGRLALNKGDALAAEVKVMERASGRVDVETELLHTSHITAELRRLAQRGVQCRVLVSRWGARDKKTVTAVASLEKAGVDVRTTPCDEKLAIAGNAAWVGSADATSTLRDADRIEWSLPIHGAHLVRDLQRRFDARWREANPLEFGGAR